MTRLAALALLFAGAAEAVPPDARLALFGKKPRIDKIDGTFEAVEVEPPGVVRAELLPTHELLLEPQGAGEARVFLFAPRLVRVVEVAIDQPLPPADAPPPLAGCATAEGAARVGSAACYEFWRGRLLHTLAADAPGLSFEEPGLFAELKAAQAELDKAGLKLRVALSPFGVRLLGEGDRRRGLRVVWPAMLGTLRLDQ